MGILGKIRMHGYNCIYGDSTAINDRNWNNIISCFTDSNLYQSNAYPRAKWPKSKIFRFYVVKNGAIVSAAQLVPIRVPFLNIDIGYVRWGPLFKPYKHLSDLNAFKLILKSMKSFCYDNGILFLRIISNVFVNDVESQIISNLFTDEHFLHSSFKPRYKTYVLNLNLPQEELFRRFEKRWRNRLKKALKNNIRVSIDNSSDSFNILKDLYELHLLNKNFKTKVYPSEFILMNSYLLNRNYLKVLICYYNDIPIGSSLFSSVGDMGLCHLSCTSELGYKLHAPYLQKWSTIKWMIENNKSLLDLGGRYGSASNSIDTFKSRLGGVETENIGCFDISINSILNNLLLILNKLKLYKYIK